MAELEHKVGETLYWVGYSSERSERCVMKGELLNWDERTAALVYDTDDGDQKIEFVRWRDLSSSSPGPY